MDNASVINCSTLNNELAKVPRECMHDYCRKNGVKSWYNNARSNPYYPVALLKCQRSHLNQ